MRRWAAALLAGTLLLLAGCSAIPTEGPVNTAPPQAAEQPGNPAFTPVGPTANEQRADIVAGFLNASTGQQQQYRIAREYLSRSFRERWNPASGVLVTNGTPKVKSDGSAATVQVAATIAASGAYTELSQATSRPLAFSLVQESGEWRISMAPNGVVVPAIYLTTLFSTLDLQYFTPGYGALVGDLRWFPRSTQSPSAVVRRLLAGAGGPLAAPVTATAFPSGTKLLSVGVSGGVATVNLRFPGGGTPSPNTLARAVRQLESTLDGLTAAGGEKIVRVQLALSGALRDEVQAAQVNASPQVAAPLVLRDGAFGYVSGSRFTPDTVLGSAIVKARPVAVTASDSLKVAAVQGSSGEVALVTSAAKRTVLDSRSGLIHPSLDPQRWVWTVPRSEPGALRAYSPGRATVSVQSGLSGYSEIDAIEVSRDGTRLLAVVQAADGTRQVVVAGIERSGDGTPVSLTTTTSVLTSLDPAIIDATWADNGSIAVLTRTNSGPDAVTLWTIGGQTSADGQLSGAVQIVGGGTAGPVVLVSGRELQQAEGGTQVWQSIATGVSLVAVQR